MFYELFIQAFDAIVLSLSSKNDNRKKHLK